MININNMLCFIKILCISIIITVFQFSHALPSSQEFKEICMKSDLQSRIDILKNSIAISSEAEIKSWISVFDNLYTSPMSYAASIGDIGILKLLINWCLQNNIIYYQVISKQEMSLLLIATIQGHTKIINLLISYLHPITMEVTVNYGITSALHQAAIRGDVSNCKLITSKQSYLLHEKDSMGFTPINYLIQSASQQIIIELLEKYPIEKIFPLDNDGKSYLHHAVIAGLYNLVKKLLDIGYNPTQEDNKGLTAINLAMGQTKSEMLRIILSKSKKKNTCCFPRGTLFSKNNRHYSRDTYLVDY